MLFGHQKTGNAVLAVSRLLKTTSVLARLGSTESTGEENLLESLNDSARRESNPEATEDNSTTAAQEKESTGSVAEDSASATSNCCVEPDAFSSADSRFQSNRGDSDSNNNNSSNNSTGGNQMRSDRHGLSPASSSKPLVQSEPHDTGSNQSTSTQLTDSSPSRTSSLASPVDAYLHPSGLSFSKTMVNCKACKGDAARFDITICGSSLPIRLSKKLSGTCSENSRDPEEIVVSWYFDGEQIFQDEHYQMSGTNSTTGNFSLIIRSIREEDEGEYSCRVHLSSTGDEVLLCCRADLSVLNV